MANTVIDLDDPAHLIAHLETQADLHADFVWAKDHLAAAAMIRSLAKLGPRPAKAKPVAPRKGRKTSR